jgi:hypothetical protein
MSLHINGIIAACCVPTEFEDRLRRQVDAWYFMVTQQELNTKIYRKVNGATIVDAATALAFTEPV